MRDYIKSFWWLFVNAGYLLLILLVSFITFTVPDQTEDFIYVFLQDFEIAYLIAVYISLPIWCFITWYSACIVLQVDPIKGSLDQKDNERHVSLSLIVPKILGIVPCFIMIYAFSSLETPTEFNHVTLHAGLMLLTASVMWIIFLSIDRLSDIKSNVGVQTPDRNKAENSNVSYDAPKGFITLIKHLRSIKPIGNWPSLREVHIFKERTNQDPSISQELIFICQFTGIKFFYKWLGLFCLALTLVMCVPTVNLFLSSFLRPGAILILALACYTLLFTIIAYFHDYSRRPFGIMVLIMVIAFSYFNDNTALRYISNNKVAKRQPVDTVFNKWIDVKKKKWVTKHDTTSAMPIVFIATQGGGIRGLAWTTRVLNHLDETYPGFIDQTFLISGVSGGGVGSTAFLSWLSDKQQSNDSVPPPTYEQFNSFTKRDFLSPVTASFAFGDNLQRFLPVAIPALDRSKMLGHTWDVYYKQCVGRSSFSQSFLEMWYKQNQFNYNVPSLILNGTLAENGQRVLTSNLLLGTSKWFEDDIDFFYATKKDISRSTAALNCSRFPFLTSGALIKECGTARGHIVDGGYRENTGLQTLVNVFCSIRKRLDKEKKSVKILIIYLQNGKDEIGDKPTATRVMQDILVPLQGLIKVNGTGVPAKSVVQFTTQMLDEAVYANVKFRLIKLDEDRESSDVSLPLGWYMSDVVSEQIDKRVSELRMNDFETISLLDQWFPKTSLSKLTEAK